MKPITRNDLKKNKRTGGVPKPCPKCGSATKCKCPEDD